MSLKSVKELEEDYETWYTFYISWCSNKYPDDCIEELRLYTIYKDFMKNYYLPALEREKNAT